MSSFFNLIEPIANLPVFIILNLLICGIVAYWYWSIVTGNFSDKVHRNTQRIGLFISVLIIGILFVKQWNIGDLLAFYSIFSLGVLILSLVKGHQEIIKESRGWFLSIFLVFFIRGYVYEPWQIPSGSMKPNLEVGDFVLVNRNAYGLEIPFTGRSKIFSKSPEIGEIVVFFPPHKPTVPYVKRVIAKGGDTINYLNKRLYINEEEYEQELIETDAFGVEILTENNNIKEYSIRHMQRTSADIFELVVPEGMYFVVGDNRDNSNDSRSWGFVKEESIWGRADYIWLSWKSGEWPNFSRVGKVK